MFAVSAIVLTRPFGSIAQQQPKIPRIGFLGPTLPSAADKQLRVFRAELRSLGYEEGRTIYIDYRWAEGDYRKASNLTQELLRLNVDLIVVIGTPMVAAAKRVATQLPIVMTVSGDPVASGLVAIRSHNAA